MEKFITIHTAQELFEFLQSIPEPIRQELPVEVFDELEPDEVRSGQVNVEAYEVRETEGCMERGFRLSPDVL